MTGRVGLRRIFMNESNQSRKVWSLVVMDASCEQPIGQIFIAGESEFVRSLMSEQ
ncbi:hypothetical protein RB2120 [Rhodopirellula baltica SH 1]|uniref:Transposase n=2 Tax=Rhodopirellula baltica TaxID=265606 RepID=Q7UWC7_RHOBA|nr:hypothetical protein RB2120 [Rhodopirellula baltica SH 1]